MRWKTLLGRCIYSDGKTIFIYENCLFRWLKFNSDALQTLLHKYSPSTPGLHYIKPLIYMAKQFPGNTCLLGLGGAGAAHALAPYIQGYKITAVEINPTIIKLASNYFMVDNLDNLEIIHQDALAYVEQCQSKFKHILVDLFQAFHFPKHCNHQVFFEKCYQLLENDGVLAVNMVNRQEQKVIFQFLKSLFPSNTLVIPIKGCSNMIVLAYKSPIKNGLLPILKTHRILKKLAWDPAWGCMAVLKT